MKIAIVVPLFPPKWVAGIEIATYNIAKYLAKRGHEVHVITSWDEGLSEEGKEDGFYVHRLKIPKVRIIRYILFHLRTFCLLKKITPKIVHAQAIPTGLSALIAKKFLHEPYLVWAHGSDVYLPNLLKKLVSMLVLKNADSIIALTENMRKEIQRIWNIDSLVIPNGIDLKKFEYLLSKEKIDGELRVEECRKIILFVGTLRPVKGVKYLIEAMNIINKKDPETILIIVGDGDERKRLEILVKELNLEECVTFVGRVSNEKVPEYMIASTVFVLPSLSEGFPVVILEAMASGLAIVATNIRGIPEIIENGENGFLICPKNPEEIAEKVLLLLEDDELRSYISIQNKEKAKEYSWEKVVEQFESVMLDSIFQNDHFIFSR